IHNIEKNYDEGAPFDEIVKTSKDRGINREFVVRAVEELTRNGEIFEPRPGYLKTVQLNY
ncbi:MAG TPA: hypothetical protein PLC12_03460, partial [Candidatus Methanofastidiosa archaeon]|nr:hypothetical protein [Candidatus Methanofastidiosa archaeon]